MTGKNDINGAFVPDSGGSSPAEAIGPFHSPDQLSQRNTTKNPLHAPPVVQPAGVAEKPSPIEEVADKRTSSEPDSTHKQDTIAVAQHDESVGVNWVHDLRTRCSLVSTILHLVVLIILAFFSFAGSPNGIGEYWIEAQQVESVESVTLELVQDNDEQESDQVSSEAEQPVTVNVALQSTSVASPIENQIEAPTISESDAGNLKSGGVATTNRHLQRVPGGGLAGRTPEQRILLGKKYGYSRESEEAVDLALQWLADHQRSNGSWSFNLNLDPCNGQCRHGKPRDEDTPTPSTAATGLALLAFLGRGYTHREGPYQENVRKGLYYLREVGRETENGLDWQHGSMYGHGIALMAVAEALTMTRVGQRYESDLMSIVEGASYFTVIAQHENGSWGYVPGSPGDTTLTGWQVMSLLAAKRNGISLRSTTLPRARDFVLSVKADDDWEFGYKGPPGEPTMNAIALTLLLYLGQSPGYTPFDRALDRIAERGPTKTNVYHDYYATLALHHSRHRDWEKWNREMRDHLVASQSQQGHERGSWHFKDRWGNVGGRLYTTAMSTMILEIYYRYLPLYADVEEFPL